MEAGRHLPCLRHLSIAGNFADEPINFHFRHFLALEVLDLSSCVSLKTFCLYFASGSKVSFFEYSGVDIVL